MKKHEKIHAKTVGELIKGLQKLDPNMPIGSQETAYFDYKYFSCGMCFRLLVIGESTIKWSDDEDYTINGQDEYTGESFDRGTEVLVWD